MTSSPQLDPRTQAIAARLSRPRLGPYLAATEGNTKDAIRLYQWNTELSGAAYEALHVFEVVLRNALDEQLCSWNAGQLDLGTGQPHASDWLMDPNHLLRRLVGSDIAKATSRAKGALRTGRPGGRAAGHADVLTQLSFGTWRYLLPDRDPGRQLLWTQSLSRAFPHLRGHPQLLVAQVNGVYRLRNRVAHLEPLLRSGIMQQELAAMRAVLKAIDPSIEEWFTSRQRVTSALRARPGHGASRDSSSL